MRAQKTRRFFSTSTRPLSPKPQISRNWPNNFYLFPNATLEPLQNPPLPNSTKQSPSLPKRNPRSPWKCSTHTLSTHIIPAAYPRVGRYKPLPPLIDERLDPTQRRERSHEMAKTLSRRQKDVRGIWNGPPLFNVVNRYARNEIPSDKKGVTIVASHATGFPKEIWEPTFQHIFQLTENPNCSVRIDEIWSIDAVTHGDSALVNEEQLNDTAHWEDNTRDILNFLHRYFPRTISSSPMAVHLPVASNSEPIRKVVGMGHSFGGCCTAWSALSSPHLFSSLVLAEPVIISAFEGHWTYWTKFVSGSIGRRSIWASRDVAKTSLIQSPFYASWDREVFDAYIEHGLASTPGGVKLKTPGYFEAAIMTEIQVQQKVWEMLIDLPTEIKLKFIMSGKDSTPYGGDLGAQDVVWRRPLNSSNVLIPDAGHLVVHEKPRELAEEVVEFLCGLEQSDSFA